MYVKTTILLIVWNILVHILLIIFYGVDKSFGPNINAIHALALHPYLVLFKGEWWRIVTALFIHMDSLHLFFNMYALYIAGRIVEIYYGRMRTLGIYFVSGIIGNIASLLLPAFSVGSSGAVFGLFGALVVIEKRVTGTAVAVLVFLIIVILLSNLAYPGRINNIAHIVGALVGYITAKHMQPHESTKIPATI